MTAVADLCPVCDRPLATEADHLTIPQGHGEHLCWGAWAPEQCIASRVDWRERALDARRDADRLREREEHFARVLAVADGGQYRADWPGAIGRLLAELAAARSLLADVAHGKLVRCASCQSKPALRVAAVDATHGICDGCFDDETRKGWIDGRGWVELPCANTLRAAERPVEPLAADDVIDDPPDFGMHHRRAGAPKGQKRSDGHDER